MPQDYVMFIHFCLCSLSLYFSIFYLILVVLYFCVLFYSDVLLHLFFGSFFLLTYADVTLGKLMEIILILLLMFGLTSQSLVVPLWYIFFFLFPSSSFFFDISFKAMRRTKGQDKRVVGKSYLHKDILYAKHSRSKMSC